MNIYMIAGWGIYAQIVSRDSYNQAKELVENRLHGFTPPKDMEEKYNEIDLIEDVAGAMIGLVSSISK